MKKLKLFMLAIGGFLALNSANIFACSNVAKKIKELEEKVKNKQECGKGNRNVMQNFAKIMKENRQCSKDPKVKEAFKKAMKASMKATMECIKKKKKK